MGTKTILGNKEHKKIIFRFLGNRGRDKPIYFRKQGNRCEPGPEVIKLFHAQLSMKFILVTNIKMPIIVGIQIFTHVLAG